MQIASVYSGDSCKLQLYTHGDGCKLQQYTHGDSCKFQQYTLVTAANFSSILLVTAANCPTEQRTGYLFWLLMVLVFDVATAVKLVRRGALLLLKLQQLVGGWGVEHTVY